jgi:hypothetical protein
VQGAAGVESVRWRASWHVRLASSAPGALAAVRRLDFGAQEFVDLDNDALEDVARSIWFRCHRWRHREAVRA